MLNDPGYAIELTDSYVPAACYSPEITQLEDRSGGHCRHWRLEAAPGPEYRTTSPLFMTIGWEHLSSKHIIIAGMIWKGMLGPMGPGVVRNLSLH